MGQVLLIAVFAVLFLRDGAGPPWFMPRSNGLVAGIAIASMVAIWLMTHALIWRQGRMIDHRGDLRAVGRCDTIAAGSRVIAVIVHGVSVLGLGWLDVVRSQ